MNKCLAYIRVSTPKQGERGVSLQEQRDTITRYAERSQIEITEWFEEQETAAKRGRPVFTRMLEMLRKGEASGVIIHKIDRSARNLRDWADLGEMIDSGIDVHFVNESLDMRSRGGRLSADIQAVVAADYVRNLREETRKGFYGRLKQGLLPLPAPLGYLDMGQGKPKIPDPVRAPLVVRAFNLYTTGRYTVRSLASEIHAAGLRNRNGGRVSKTTISHMLNNPFYVGLIQLAKTGETFQGVHQPLIPKVLFERVESILRGKAAVQTFRHEFLFRRLIACRYCGYHLIGERQKGHVYYRCHTNGCPTKTLREELAEAEFSNRLAALQFSTSERVYFKTRILEMDRNWGQQKKDLESSIELQVKAIQERLNRLTDALIDRMIEKDVFEERKKALLMERQGLRNTLDETRAGKVGGPTHLSNFLELVGNAYLLYKKALPYEKREMVEFVTSNRVASEKSVEFTLSEPFQLVADRSKNENGRPYRDRHRTLERLLRALSKYKGLPALSWIHATRAGGVWKEDNIAA